ncbi:MAG: response regulator [Anaerolineales bacterium]|nr:response regulator [Anaerolineales bacterium]
MENRAKVLIVDDDQNLRKTLTDILNSRGYDPIAFADGDNAIRHAFSDPPHLALIDLRLEGKSGIEILGEIRAGSPFTECIVLTGHGSRGTAIEAINLGAYSYLLKPYDVDQLLLTIQRAVEKSLAEMALRENEERFRSVTETAAEAIIVANESGDIRFWNAAAVSTFGYQADDIIGQPISTIVPERYIQAHTSSINKSAAGRSLGRLSSHQDLYGLRKDGSEFPITLSLASWESSDGRYFSAIIRDVTEVRETQRRVEAQERLAAVGQLAAGIAHDFNNSIGAVVLYTDLLLRKLELSEKDRERLNIIKGQAKHASMLTSQILDFSRRSVMERMKMDLLPQLKDTVKLLVRTLPENIQIRWSADAGQYIIDGDPTRIQQVLMNLALNAKDAMPEGGKLSIELTTVAIESAPEEQSADGINTTKVQIRVFDTGIGIPNENLDRIFEPFFTTKSAGRGTGLGLAQVYGIVSQLNGHIAVESEEGVGTSFTLSFPLLDAPASDIPSKPEEVNIKGKGELVLVVEDDDVTREALGEILESINYKVLLASDGSEALSLLQEESTTVQLILSDIIMPTIGGKTLSMLVQERYPDIPIVLMTGYPLGEDDLEFLEGGNVKWMQKPIAFEDLGLMIRKTLNRK